MPDTNLVRDVTGALGVIVETSPDADRIKVRRGDGREAWVDASLLQGDRLTVALERLSDADPTPDALVVPIVEERLVIDRRVEETGVVRIRKTVEEKPATVRYETVEDKVDIERVPVNRVVETAPETRQEGDVTVIPVLEEVVVVEKRLMLREEIRISRVRTTVPQEQTVVLRTEHATVERDEPSN